MTGAESFSPGPQPVMEIHSNLSLSVGDRTSRMRERWSAEQPHRLAVLSLCRRAGSSPTLERATAFPAALTACLPRHAKRSG